MGAAMARSEFTPLGALLPRLLAKRGAEVRLLAPLWREAVGPGLAHHSSLLSLEEGVLVAAISPQYPAFLEALRASRGMIVERLNALAGRKLVTRLDLVAQAVEGRSRGGG